MAQTYLFFVLWLKTFHILCSQHTTQRVIVNTLIFMWFKINRHLYLYNTVNVNTLIFIWFKIDTPPKICPKERVCESFVTTLHRSYSKPMSRNIYHTNRMRIQFTLLLPLQKEGLQTRMVCPGQQHPSCGFQRENVSFVSLDFHITSHFLNNAAIQLTNASPAEGHPAAPPRGFSVAFPEEGSGFAILSCLHKNNIHFQRFL